MAVLGVGLQETMQRNNATKNVLAMLVNGVAAVVFIAVAEVDWAAAGLVAVGAVVGGQVGATVGRRLPPVVLRGVIVVVGGRDHRVRTGLTADADASRLSRQGQRAQPLEELGVAVGTVHEGMPHPAVEPQQHVGGVGVPAAMALPGATRSSGSLPSSSRCHTVVPGVRPSVTSQVHACGLSDTHAQNHTAPPRGARGGSAGSASLETEKVRNSSTASAATSASRRPSSCAPRYVPVVDRSLLHLVAGDERDVPLLRRPGPAGGVLVGGAEHLHEAPGPGLERSQELVGVCGARGPVLLVGQVPRQLRGRSSAILVQNQCTPVRCRPGRRRPSRKAG